jgi:cation diffusion facilitator CzcD-associated flavoprotein CzcO
MPTAIVVGAGVAGLQACRALAKRGFDVLVLEQSSGVGGVWSRNYQVGAGPVKGGSSTRLLAPIVTHAMPCPAGVRHTR